MCFVALDISKGVKFAAEIDSNGKLIAGTQCKNDYCYINNGLAKNRILQTTTSTLSLKENRQDNLNASTTFCHYNTSYLFYANYLTPILKRIKTNFNFKRSEYNVEQESSHLIELVQIHGLLKIAVTPLTATIDRYLCMYIESELTNQEVIAKLRNAI